MYLFGQYEIIKNENTVLTCKDAKNMYYIETKLDNTFNDTSIDIKNQDNVIVMPYYEYNLKRLYTEFPQLINANNIMCIISLLTEKLEKLGKMNKRVCFATTNIFMTEKMGLQVLPLSVEYDVECVSTFFKSEVVMVALELLLHENTEKNINLKNYLYDKVFKPEIREIAGDELYAVIEKMYRGQKVNLSVDTKEFLSLVDRVVFKHEKIEIPQVKTIDATNMNSCTNANNNNCSGSHCNGSNCNEASSPQNDLHQTVSQNNRSKLDTNILIEPFTITESKPKAVDVSLEIPKVAEALEWDEPVSKKKYTIVTLSAELAKIENSHHKLYISPKDKVCAKLDAISLKDESDPLFEFRKGRFLVKQNLQINIFNKDNMNKMRQIIEKQKQLIIYIKKDSQKYKKEIKKLEDELREMGCVTDEEQYSKGATW